MIAVAHAMIVVFVNRRITRNTSEAFTRCSNTLARWNPVEWVPHRARSMASEAEATGANVVTVWPTTFAGANPGADT